MTRKEEIQKLIDEEMGIDNYGSLDFQVGVDYGVKYADKTMIEKACQWIEKHIFDFPWYDNEQGDFSSKDIANALRKAMEEEYEKN